MYMILAVQRWAIRLVLCCATPISLHRPWRDFTQPRAHVIPDLIGDAVRPESANLDDGLLHAARVDEVGGGRGGRGGDEGLAAAVAAAGEKAVMLLRHCLHTRQERLGQRQGGRGRLKKKQ